LNLVETNVTDTTLKALTAIKGLQNLYLGDTKVTDAGMKALTSLKGLRDLRLMGTKVTDAGVKELTALKGLESLFLEGTKVTDAGVKELTALTGLQFLGLSKTQVTDAGVKELTTLKVLSFLDLRNTKVTDAGVKELTSLKALRFLDLSGTQVTDAGAKELKEALPKCFIGFSTLRRRKSVNRSWVPAQRGRSSRRTTLVWITVWQLRSKPGITLVGRGVDELAAREDPASNRECWSPCCPLDSREVAYPHALATIRLDSMAGRDGPDRGQLDGGRYAGGGLDRILRGRSRRADVLDTVTG
jgi:hypothetical protein